MGASSRSPSPMTMVPRMGNGVHGLAHGLGGNLVGELALALAHGAGRSDGRHFDHAQKPRRQVAFNVFPETAGLAFRTSLSSHKSLRNAYEPAIFTTGLRITQIKGRLKEMAVSRE